MQSQQVQIQPYNVLLNIVKSCLKNYRIGKSMFYVLDRRELVKATGELSKEVTLLKPLFRRVLKEIAQELGVEYVVSIRRVKMSKTKYFFCKTKQDMELLTSLYKERTGTKILVFKIDEL